MIDKETLTQRTETDVYLSYHMPNGHVLFQVKELDNIQEYLKGMTTMFRSAMLAGKEMLRTDQCSRFTIQAVDFVKDEPDAGMIILMVQ